MSQSFKNQDASFLHALRRNCQLSIFKHLTKALLIMALLMPTIAFSQSEKISINLKNTSLEEVFNRIETLSGYAFIYDSNITDLDRKVNITAQDKSINAILTELFSGTDVEYTFSEKRVILKKKTTIAKSNGLVVKGKITSASGESLPAVNVIIKGTTIGVFADMDGNYSITIPDNIKDPVLRFAFMGYAEQELAVGSKGELNVALTDMVSKLDEVVVVAYGTQNKRSVTGAMETVKMSDLGDLPVAQFTQKMQGQISGVQVSQTTGKPGQGINVRIRGGASISTNSSPLYVVDGFPIVGDINNISANEIESITVLKDAAATSLYGSRAAFGVVLVTTKRAKSGETSITANAYVGIQQVPQKGRPDMMNGSEWAQFRKENFEDLGQPVPDAFKNPAQYGEGYNWYDAMLRNAMIGDYSVSINASKNGFSSSIVLGYFSQEGVMINSKYNRFSARANNEYKFNDKLKVAFNIAPSFSYDNAPPSDGFFVGGGGLLYNAKLTPPILSWEKDGTMPANLNDIAPAGVLAFPTPNWVRSANDITNKTQWNRLLTNGYIEYELIKDLKLKTSISIDMGNSNKHFFKPSTAGQSFANPANQQQASLSDQNNRYWSWLSENIASYAKQFGDHSFDLLGGYTAQQFRSDFSEISGSNFADDRIQTIDKALVKNNPHMDIQEWSMMSYLGRLNYNYKGRYFVSGSIRRDGSSRFGKNNRWGNFPAASVGWIASEERFMQNVKPISFLKLRGSYGLTGNNNIGNYRHSNEVGGANVIFGNNIASGNAPTRMGNDNLGWEMTKQLDLGLDLGFVNNRINFSYDFFDKRVTELLYELQIPTASGFSNFNGNVGELKFWGHEFSLNTRNLVGEFTWSTNFNVSFSDNKVLALAGNTDQIIYHAETYAATITKVGGRIGQFYGPIQLGVYVDQNDLDKSPHMTTSEVGTIKFEDVNGDGVITLIDGKDGDHTEIGNPFPKAVFGFTNSFSYKNFDLLIVTSGTYGNKVWANEEGTTNLDGVFNVRKGVKDRWRSPANPGAGEYGKTTGPTEPDRRSHSRSVYNGSHLSINNVTLGYNLPKNLVKGITNFRIYGSIQQLYTFTKYPYGNPQAGVDSNGNTSNSLAQGMDFSTYPMPRTFTFGLTLNF